MNVRLMSVANGEITRFDSGDGSGMGFDGGYSAFAQFMIGDGDGQGYGYMSGEGAGDGDGRDNGGGYGYGDGWGNGEGTGHGDGWDKTTAGLIQI